MPELKRSVLRKLNDKNGAAIIMALLVLLVGVFASSMVLSSAVASAKTIEATLSSLGAAAKTTEAPKDIPPAATELYSEEEQDKRTLQAALDLIMAQFDGKTYEKIVSAGRDCHSEPASIFYKDSGKNVDVEDYTFFDHIMIAAMDKGYQGFIQNNVFENQYFSSLLSINGMDDVLAEYRFEARPGVGLRDDVSLSIALSINDLNKNKLLLIAKSDFKYDAAVEMGILFEKASFNLNNKTKSINFYLNDQLLLE